MHVAITVLRSLSLRNSWWPYYEVLVLAIMVLRNLNPNRSDSYYSS